jgi:hypothetical protein
LPEKQSFSLSQEVIMRKTAFVLGCLLALVVGTAGTALAGYVCEYSNSEVTGNDASNRITGIAVLSEDNFALTINRESVPIYALCKWTDATATTGRGNDVQQWFYNFDTVNMENPFGMAVDGNDYLYLCNNDPDRNILVFDGTPADPEASPYRLATGTEDTLYTIDVDDEGYVYVGYCNSENDRVDIYPPITDDMWTTHSGSPMTTVALPEGQYLGMCVNGAGTELYVSEYASSVITRYTGSPATGFTLDGGFSLQIDSLATAIDLDEQGYLYVVSDFASSMLFENPAGYSWFWVIDLNTGVVTDKVDMYSPNGGSSSETSAGYHSAVDIEVDEAGSVYVVHYYAWAIEKWVGSPSTGVESVQSSGDLPYASVLVQNYPNPFNASTEIRYRLPADTQVRLDVFNVAGQLAERLVDGHQAAGEHLVEWTPADLPSGVYFIRLQAGGQMAVTKAALVR